MVIYITFIYFISNSILLQQLTCWTNFSQKELLCVCTRHTYIHIYINSLKSLFFLVNVLFDFDFYDVIFLNQMYPEWCTQIPVFIHIYFMTTIMVKLCYYSHALQIRIYHVVFTTVPNRNMTTTTYTKT